MNLVSFFCPLVPVSFCFYLIDDASFAATSDSYSDEGDITGLSCKNLRENDQLSDGTNIPERNHTSSDEKPELNELVAYSSSSDGGHMCSDDFSDSPDRKKALSVLGKTNVLSLPDKNGCSDFDEKMVDGMSEDKDWSTTSGSLSPNASDNSENGDCAEYQLPESCYISFGNMFPVDMNVIIFPDYIIYEKTLYTESQVTFSVESIKIECSDPSGLDDKLVAEWCHSDVGCLGCQWSASVDAALVKLCVRADGMTKTKKHQDDSENVNIIFSVTEANWAETEQRIMNLAERYKKIWNSNSSDDMMWDDADISSRNISISRRYLSNIAEPFEEVVYPKGDPDAVSISKRDVDLLQPETFVNDTIIDFYIKYLKNKIPPNKKQSFHFFNSFFFRKLADLDKERGSVSEGRSAFLRVRKWTRKVNIFEKDYIFIPVNFNLHWSLLVICHPGEVANMKDGDAEDFPKLPCVLHLDSIKGTHSGVKNIIRSYIWEEWKERHPELHENDSSNFSSLRFVPLELPQQENSFDCGLFLLHYVELFLEEATLDFNPLNISNFDTFLTADWFQPSEASLKRSVIWNLIYELINDPGQQAIHPPSNIGLLSSPVIAEHNDEQGAIIELVSEPHTASTKKVSFCGVVKCCENQEVGLQEFLEQEAPSVRSSQHIEHINYDNEPHILMDDECTNEQLVLTNIDGDYDHSWDEQLIVDACVTSSHLRSGPHEGSINYTEEGTEQNVLHDISNLKDMVVQNNESFVAAVSDNCGFVTDLVASICQEKLNGHSKEYEENDEIKLEAGDSGGSRIGHAVEEDKEYNRLSCKTAESVEVASEKEKEVQMIDMGIQVENNDYSNKAELTSEHCQEECSTRIVTEEQDCQDMSVYVGKNEDYDGQRSPQIASPDEATCDDASSVDEVQLLIDMVDQQPNKRRKLS